MHMYVGIEMFKKMMDYGQAGDNVGILLRGTLYFILCCILYYTIYYMYRCISYTVDQGFRVPVYGCLYTLNLLTSLIYSYTYRV